MARAPRTGPSPQRRSLQSGVLLGYPKTTELSKILLPQSRSELWRPPPPRESAGPRGQAGTQQQVPVQKECQEALLFPALPPANSTHQSTEVLLPPLLANPRKRLRSLPGEQRSSLERGLPDHLEVSRRQRLISLPLRGSTGWGGLPKESCDRARSKPLSLRMASRAGWGRPETSWALLWVTSQ